MVKKVAQRAIAAGLAGMMSFGAALPAAMAIDDRVMPWWAYDAQYITDDEDLTYFRRIAGDTRYDTMKKIVEATYKLNGDYYWHAPAAVVASGDNFPDALAANGFAGALNGGDGAPVILTKKGTLSSQAKTLLKNMQVQHVYIMGGTAAVSQETENAIRDLKISTTRVAGADRQATSAEAFKLIDGNWAKKHGTHSVIIATGANYADALSIAPFAYATGTPIVLTKADGTLTEDQVKLIKDDDEIWRVIIVGGTKAVSDSAITAIGTYNGKYNDYKGRAYITYRISGADRYDTSAKIADWEVNEADKWLLNPYTSVVDLSTAYGPRTAEVVTEASWDWAGFTYDWTFVATGENFPDALAGGQLAGGHWYVSGGKLSKLKPNSPILLTKDGNRAADAVIAANLAWNRNIWQKNATELYANYIDWTDLYGTTLTSAANLRDFIADYIDNGFFTVGAIGGQLANGALLEDYVDADGFYYGTVTFDAQGNPDPDGTIWTYKKDENGVLRGCYKQQYADGTWALVWGAEFDPSRDTLREVAARYDLFTWAGTTASSTNFRGIIFGGTAAVSKDKAKQLDDTVKDTIGVYDDGWVRSDLGDAASLVAYINGRVVYASDRPTSVDGATLQNFYVPTNWYTRRATVNNFSTNGTFDTEVIIPLRHYQYKMDPLYANGTWGYVDDDLALDMHVRYVNGVVTQCDPQFIWDFDANTLNGYDYMGF